MSIDELDLSNQSSAGPKGLHCQIFLVDAARLVTVVQFIVQLIFEHGVSGQLKGRVILFPDADLGCIQTHRHRRWSLNVNCDGSGFAAVRHLGKIKRPQTHSG